MDTFALPESMVGGWPMAVQDSVRMGAGLERIGNPTQLDDDAMERATKMSANWRQVAQLSPNCAGLKWLGEGVLYLLIDQADLAARRWDRAWPTMQFY